MEVTTDSATTGCTEPDLQDRKHRVLVVDDDLAVVRVMAARNCQAYEVM